MSETNEVKIKDKKEDIAYDCGVRDGKIGKPFDSWKLTGHTKTEIESYNDGYAFGVKLRIAKDLAALGPPPEPQ